MNDRQREKDQDGEETQEKDLLSRRKLVYVAPVLMSKRMFYRASGCVKHSGQNSLCNASSKGS
jgi:hypothetical protein